MTNERLVLGVLTNERLVLGVLTNERRVLPYLAEPVELVRGLLTNSRGRGAEQSVDDEVGHTGKVIES